MVDPKQILELEHVKEWLLKRNLDPKKADKVSVNDICDTVYAMLMPYHDYHHVDNVAIVHGWDDNGVDAVVIFYASDDFTPVIVTLWWC